MLLRRTTHGVGVVFVNGFGIWALWVRVDASAWRVRMSLDGFDKFGLQEFQRVRLRIPGDSKMYLYLRGRRENPLFVWLEFGTDVRRL
jgi:hypothetical protein